MPARFSIRHFRAPIRHFRALIKDAHSYCFVSVHVIGEWRGSLGALFVSTDWQVRVLWLSGIVYRPSEHMYISTTPLSGCMYRLSCYIPFYYQAWMYIWYYSCRRHNPLKNYPLTESPSGDHQGPENFPDNWTACGLPHTETVSSKNW